MGRITVDVAVPPLALRRPQAAAALGVSVDVFDEHIRPDLPVIRVAGVVTYPVKGLQEWLESNEEQPAATHLRKKAA